MKKYKEAEKWFIKNTVGKPIGPAKEIVDKGQANRLKRLNRERIIREAKIVGMAPAKYGKLSAIEQKQLLNDEGGMGLGNTDPNKILNMLEKHGYKKWRAPPTKKIFDKNFDIYSILNNNSKILPLSSEIRSRERGNNIFHSPTIVDAKKVDASVTNIHHNIYGDATGADVMTR